MRKRGKKVVSAMAIVTLLAGSIGITGINWTTGEAKADITTETTSTEDSFMVGQNTGTNFGDGEWEIRGIDKNGNALTGSYAPAIMTDPYGNVIGDNNKIIRLINGVSANSTGDIYSAETGTSTYRSGSAFIHRKVTLNDNYEFSAKFTVSMPDACVDYDPNGSREPGGDGIAFVIQPNARPEGEAGGGMGYQGITNSLIVELDSFFNGGYYYPQGADNGFENWGFSNQVLTYNGGSAQPGSTESHDNYKGIDANTQQRFDHIGIMTGGDQKNHLDLAYLAGNDPCEWDGSDYTNLNENISGQNGYQNTADNSFAEEGENNRLFTVWVQYDGSTLTARVSNGDFLNADYNAPIATISKAISASDMGSYLGGNKDVYIGFTSAVGSSKANHTVHSVAFSNRYYEDGIPKPVKYTVKYYVERTNEPDSSNIFILDSVEYVLKETSEPITVLDGTIITSDEVTAGKKNKFDGYVFNTAKASNGSADGSVLKVEANEQNEFLIFYKSTAATYTIEYYKEKSDGTFEKVEADTESNIPTNIGTKVDVSVGRDLANKYSSENFKLDTTVSGTLISKTINEKENIFKVYYIKNTSAPYVVEYYIKGNGDTEYEKAVELTENKIGTIGDTRSVTPPATITVGGKTYKFDDDNISNILTLEIKGDGSTVFKLYFEEVKEDVTEPVTTKEPATPDEPAASDAPRTEDVIGDRLKITTIAIAIFGMTVVTVNSKRRKKN